jgi:hypothetical protein
MAEPSPASPSENSTPPPPEMLKPQGEAGSSPTTPSAPGSTDAAKPKQAKRTSYRPSHKATFIGLIFIVIILVVNVAVIALVIKSQQKKNSPANLSAVSLSSDTLGKLGVNRSGVGNLGEQLSIGPNSTFNGTVSVAKDVTIGGQLKLNSKFSATDASLAQLEAGNTSLNQLDVNGDATVSNLSLRKDLSVTGTARFLGSVSMAQLLTINNGLNVTVNLAVGGALTANSFHASSLTSDTTLTIGGHVITRGTAPGVGPGSALGNNGTVSISGNDSAGTVAANIGTGAGSGIVANIAFRAQYGSIPHVVVTAIGAGIGSVYVTRSIGGFSIGVNGALAPGGYAFDYIVEQ